MVCYGISGVVNNLPSPWSLFFNSDWKKASSFDGHFTEKAFPVLFLGERVVNVEASMLPMFYP